MRLEPGFLRKIVHDRASATAFAIDLLSERERGGARALYVFVLVCRDAINLAGSRQEAQSSVALLTRLFEFGVVQRYAADHSIVDAVIDAVPDFGLAWEAWSFLEEDFEIPRAYAIEFIRGLKQDADGYRPETVEDLLRYTYRSGGVLGLMACHILAVDETSQQAAVDLASAARLYSLAGDVYRDFTLGRIFSPLNWISYGASVKFAPSWATEAAVKFRKLATVLEAAAQAGLATLPYRRRLAISIAMVLHREARSSITRKVDRAADEIIRHSADAFWRYLRPRLDRVRAGARQFSFSVAEAFEKKTLRPIFHPALRAEVHIRTHSLPVRDLATALRNQNLLIGREL